MKSKTSFTYFVFLVLFASAGAVCFGQKPELVIQTGHSGYITSVVFSADGKLVASSSSDQTIKLWNPATGTQLRTLIEDSTVDALAFSGDGKTLISASYDAVKLWDLTTGTVRKVERFGSERLGSVIALSADGKKLAAASGGSITVWDVFTGGKVHTFTGSQESIASLALSADGKMLVSSSETINVWDLTSGKAQPKLSWPNHNSLKGGLVHGLIKVRVGSVAISADGRSVAANTDNNTIKVWDTATGSERGSFRPGADSKDLSLSPDGLILASHNYSPQDLDNKIQFWDVTAGLELRTLSSGEGPINFSMDGKKLAGGAPQNSIQLWDVSTGSELVTLGTHSSSITSVAFVGQSQAVASRSGNTAIKLWSANSSNPLRSLEGGAQVIFGFAVTPDGKTLASYSSDTIKLWEVANGHELQTLRCFGHAVDFSPDGKMLACGSFEVGLLTSPAVANSSLCRRKAELNRYRSALMESYS